MRVAFDLFDQIERGDQTAVAINDDDVVVTVYRDRNALMSHLATATGTYVRWRGQAKPYATGSTPRVAIHGASAVGVHETADGKLAYVLGGIGANDFGLSGPVRPYGPGRSASVAMTGPDVIGVEESGDASHTLYYRIGTIASDRTTLTGWDTRRPIPGASGSQTGVAINSSDLVVAVYLSGRTTYAIVGTLAADRSSIDWGSPLQLGEVIRPAVALTDSGSVIITSLAGANLRLAYGIARVDPVARVFGLEFAVSSMISSSINGNSPGGNMGVAANDRLAVTTFANSQLQIGYAASLVQDRANWMRDSLPMIGSRNLEQLVIPGSHDAVTYELHGFSGFGATCNTKTQILSIFDQLRAGVRYFDIRPLLDGGVLGTGHFGTIFRNGIFNRHQGGAGPSLATILDEVKRFMELGGRELVILKFSHYLNRTTDESSFTAAEMQMLADAVVDALGAFLVKGIPTRIPETPLRDLLGQRGSVFVVFDIGEGYGGFPGARPDGIYLYQDYDPNASVDLGAADLNVYDKFANSNDAGRVITDQLAKLADPRNHGGDLFLLSWTVTQSDSQSAFCNDSNTLANDILTLAAMADSALPYNLYLQYVNGRLNPPTVPNIIYLDSVAGFAGDAAIFLDQRMNLGDSLLASQRPFLGAGESLLSAGGAFRLTYQIDGDVVLSNARDGARVRSISGSAGGGAWRCILTEEANFIVFRNPYTQVFASDTHASGGKLTLTDDGAVVISDGNGREVKRL